MYDQSTRSESARLLCQTGWVRAVKSFDRLAVAMPFMVLLAGCGPLEHRHYWEATLFWPDAPGGLASATLPDEFEDSLVCDAGALIAMDKRGWPWEREVSEGGSFHTCEEVKRGVGHFLEGLFELVGLLLLLLVDGARDLLGFD